MFRYPRSIHHVAALAAAFALVAGTAWAKDSQKGSFTNPDPSITAPFDDCASSGSNSGGGSKVSYKLKKLVGMPDGDGVPCSGDEIICIALAEVNLTGFGPSATGVVTFGEVKKGGTSIKHDLCKENPIICSFPGEVPSYKTDAMCYEPDGGAYLALTSTSGEFPLVISGCDRIGFALGNPSYPFPLPASPMIAREGMTNCP